MRMETGVGNLKRELGKLQKICFCNEKKKKKEEKKDEHEEHI